MSMEDVYGKPGHLIRRVQQIAVAVFMRECAAYDITPVQYAALVAIRENPGLDATRISALISFDRSTIGNVLERLETKGVIERSANPDDKRVKILHLSAKGARLLRDVEPAVARAQERILAPLPAAKRRDLMKGLAAIVAAHEAG